MQFLFACDNGGPVAPILGLNTALIVADLNPVPNIYAIAATVNNDGYVNIPGLTGTGFFTVATTNIGVSGTITVMGDTNGVPLPVSILVCQTDTSGDCLAIPSPSVTLTIAANAQPSFAFFVTGSGFVPDDPAHNRVFARFKQGSVLRGATSVGVRTQ